MSRQDLISSMNKQRPREATGPLSVLQGSWVAELGLDPGLSVGEVMKMVPLQETLVWHRCPQLFYGPLLAQPRETSRFLLTRRERSSQLVGAGQGGSRRFLIRLP